VREREFKKKITENEINKNSIDKAKKLKQNHSEQENLKDNSEVKNESSDTCLPHNTNINNIRNHKESFKFSDDAEIEVKIVNSPKEMKDDNLKRKRKKIKSEKVMREVEEVIKKKNKTEREVIRDSDIIYKGENGNEEIFEVKVRNTKSKRKNEDVINKKDRSPKQRKEK
jgi:hypothetical protein